ncbi:MAG: PDZ domain-containing protein [Gemmatimonadaceae bacterium]
MLRATALLTCLIASGVLSMPAEAQRTRTSEAPRARAFRMLSPDVDSDRAVLGVTTSSSNERDTLGLLITSITPGSPAEAAGLEEGNRIATINGVDLALAPADAGEPDMRGLVTRRLSREMGKVEAGDEVKLRVWADGRYNEVTVRPVAADELPGRERLTREEREEARANRAVVGLNLSASATVRDSLGVLIVRVVPGGPAEAAGLLEGNRVAAVNGVDLRVAAADAGDRYMSSARVNRFTREVGKLEAGDAVELRVWSDGAFRDITMTTARSEDVYEDGGWRFFTGEGGGDFMIAPVPPVPPIPPLAPLMDGVRILRHGHMGDVQEAVVRARAASDALGAAQAIMIEPAVQAALEAVRIREHVIVQ